MTTVDVSAAVGVDVERVARLFAADAAGLLGDEVGLDVGSGPKLHQRVTMTLGTPEHPDTGVRWPLSWEPTGFTTTLPAFSGSIEATAAQHGGTRLRVTGSYRPPLGVLGIIVDSVIGQRVAEASVEQFATAVARRVERAAARTVGAHRPRA